MSCVQTDSTQKDISWTKPDLEGHWKLIDAEIVDKVTFLGISAPEPDPMTMVYEDSPWDGYVEYDLVFENDTMYRINYPIEASSPIPFFLDTGYIHLGHFDSLYTYPTELVQDTLTFYRPVWSDPGFFKETYVRTSFNDSTLNVMKTFGINYPELAGTWYLVRELDYDYGTHYELNFPYELPDSIQLSRDRMIKSLGNEKSVIITTDSVERDYSFYYYDHHIHVKPGSWCNENDPWIFFSRYY